ncbi:hypothetical protein [Leptolyngbya sp. O-77]|uniref:hypothetical protein n=1 Tax=Leptolyngbya sp. O-77 TaxID=1080068 RepID=UPI0012E3499F|nr:hypothetical protein [Leptolyngbya sp. O-77]
MRQNLWIIPIARIAYPAAKLVYQFVTTGSVFESIMQCEMSEARIPDHAKVLLQKGFVEI